MTRTRNLLLAFVAILIASTTSAPAQNFPSKPIRIVVPYAAGGDLDRLARWLAPPIGEALAQPVIVENRVGAGGNVGHDAVAKAAPDGHTVLMATVALAMVPSLYKKPPFDATRDLVPVTQLIGTTLVLVAGPKLAAGSLAEFVTLAKTRPGSLSYGSSGTGSTLQLAMEMVKSAAGIDVVSIPYKGDAPVYTALLAGEIEVAVVPLSTSLSHVRGGKLRALGVTSPRRAAALAEVPTLAEAGLAGFEMTSWQGFFVPARTPREVIDTLHRETARALAHGEIRERIVALGQDPVASTPSEFTARFQRDIGRFADIIAKARIPTLD